MLRILIDIDLELKSQCTIVELVEASGTKGGCQCCNLTSRIMKYDDFRASVQVVLSGGL